MFFSLSQMPQKMPWFSKDTMRATLCTLVFLFSLPRSLNGHLTTSQKNTEVPNTVDLRQKDFSIDSARDNVVLLSGSVQKLHLIRPKTPYGDEISKERINRNIQNDEHNLTTKTQEVVATSQKVLIHLQKERLNVSNTDVSPKEKPKMRLLDILEATHVSVSRSIQTQHFTSHSEQGSVRLQMLNSKGKTSYHRTKRNTLNADQNSTTTMAKPKTKMIPEEATTLQKEQQKPKQHSRRPHTASPLWIENATELIVTNKTPNTTRVDVLPEEKTSMLKAIEVSVSRYMQMAGGVHPRTLNGKVKTSNQRTKRKADDVEHNFTTILAQSQKRTMQKEETTEEQRNLDIQHTTSENATELNDSIKTSNVTKVDTVLPMERTSRGPSEMSVVQISLSSVQRFTSQSKQQDIWLKTSSNDDKTTNQRTRRNVEDSKHNFTTLGQPERQITQDEVTTPQNEQLRPTETSTRLHNTSSLLIENATDFYISTQPSSAMMADVSPIETTSRGRSETTPQTPTSNFTELYEVQTNETGMGGNNTNTYEDVHTSKPSMETTDQPSPITHLHTSTIIATTNLNGNVGSSSVKTTEKLETPLMTKTTSTAKKTTPKLSYPSPTSKEKKKGNPGPAVAAVIVTTLVLMFIAIIVILVKKRKMQKRQLENPEWAGPSPFLDGDVQPNLPTMEESEAINRQRFNQISLSRYLPNRLSKQLASGRNTSEEVLMGDILQGSTFGRQIPDETQAPNGNSTAARDPIEMEENKIQEAQASVDSSDAKSPLPENAQETGIDSEESKQTDDLTPSPSPGTDITIKPPPLVSIDLDSLSEEAVTLQTSDGGIVPPAPPLP